MVEASPGLRERFHPGKAVAKAASFIGQNLALSLVVGGLCFYLPVFLLELLREATEVVATDPGLPAVLITAIVASLTRLLVIAPIFFGMALLSKAAAGFFYGDRPSIGACARAALRRLSSVLGVGIVIVLGLFLARQAVLGIILKIPPPGVEIVSVLLFMPFLVIGLATAIAIPVAMQEELGTLASIWRARALTREASLPIFGMVLVVVAMLVLVLLTTSHVLTPVEAFPVLSMITWMLISTLLTATYVELRRIEDGPGADELVDVFS